MQDLVIRDFPDAVQVEIEVVKCLRAVGSGEEHAAAIGQCRKSRQQ